MELELVDAFDIEQAFGIQGPDKLPCLSLRDHIAQKTHGMTRPSMDHHTNERVQDAIDVLLFRDSFATETEQQHLCAACERLFKDRGTHDWPPLFDPPNHWRSSFSAMAQELELQTTDLESATRELRGFIDVVAAAKR